MLKVTIAVSTANEAGPTRDTIKVPGNRLSVSSEIQVNSIADPAVMDMVNSVISSVAGVESLL